MSPIVEVGPAALETCLTISLFRPGLDARPGRYLKELVAAGETNSVECIADAIYIDPAERKLELSRAKAEAERGLERARRAGFHIIPFGHRRYPRLLAEIADPPAVLWARGELDAVGAPAVAVVGSRDATPASLAVARTLGRELTEAGLVLVSGLARGIDGAAHGGALEGTGRTVAVLGSGLDVVYPAQHKPLAERVAQAGAVVSELPPWMGPIGRHFPFRNRIISGLSLGVVVVEAAENSGSLITAKLAVEQSRDVMAVPGNILSGRYRGAHALIKEGARLVETVEDVLEEIGWHGRPLIAAAGADNSLSLSDLENEMAVGEDYGVEDLAVRKKLTAQEVLAELSVLELSGRVVRTSGGRFMRKPRRLARG